MINNKYEFNSEAVERLEAARKRNDEELDKLCKCLCLIIGWFLVLCLFIYIIYIIANR